MKLIPEETELVGKWVVEDRQPRADATSERINWLTAQYLRHIAISEESGGWDTLFQDPDDGRYWERTYPQSNLHGGGPPTLRCLSRDQARLRYGDEIE